MSIGKDLVDIIKGNDNKGTKPYDTSATVTRVEDSTVWVHIPGGVDETPVKKTISAKEGDVVQVRVSGGSAWLNGNASAPPTDDATAVKANATADVAYVAAENAVNSANQAAKAAASAEQSAQTAYNAATNAQTAAGNAQTSANNALASAQNASEYAARALGNLSTVQSVAETLTWITQHGTMTLTTDVALDPTHVYFVVDAGGDYTVGGVTYAIVTEPDVDDIATYYELTIDESLNNYVGTHLALTQEGLWLLPASSGTNKVLIATGAGSTYTTAGTYLIDNSGGTVASFRADGATINGNGSYFVAHLGYGEALGAGGALGNNPYFSLGERNSSATAYNSSSTYSVGDLCVYNDRLYVCTTDITTAEAWTSSHWQVAIGGDSFASGYNNIASGTMSAAIGRSNKSIGIHSLASGQNSISHASHSRAHGQNTIASAQWQTVIGRNNVPQGNPQSSQYSDYALIIGNGYDDTSRSNALTVDWYGNVNIASGAKYKINGNNLSASDVGAVPTSRTVNSKALSSNITLSASDVGALASSSVADYITSKGTSGSWYYEKWNSGKIEAIFKGSVTYGTMSASGQLYRSTNNAVAIPGGIFAATPQRTEITINNAATVVVCATAVASSSTNVNVQVWRSTNAASSIDATIRCTYIP